jgi:PIN domain nuclease of toxin-antitoxin system
MTYLIDTQTFLWALEENPRLSKKAKLLMVDPDNAIIVSIASLWEIALKVSIGKLELARPLHEIINNLPEADIAMLPIEPQHTLVVENLPFIHRDPFDRMIIAQAKSENFEIISSDGILGQYDVVIHW